MCRALVCLFILTCMCPVTKLHAQTRTLNFLNAMQSQATVKIFAAGSATPTEFDIDPTNPVAFTFPEGSFDIQVIPRDEPNSGFRFENVNLTEVANESVDGIIRLDGKFGPSRTQTYCFKRRRRSVCRCCTVRGERIEVDLVSSFRNGRRFEVASPKMTYDELEAASAR